MYGEDIIKGLSESYNLEYHICPYGTDIYELYSPKMSWVDYNFIYDKITDDNFFNNFLGKDRDRFLISKGLGTGGISVIITDKSLYGG